MEDILEWLYLVKYDITIGHLRQDPIQLLQSSNQERSARDAALLARFCGFLNLGGKSKIAGIPRPAVPCG